MQSSFPYFDILIFGVIAVFLILRLRNILGTKTDTNDQGINKKETSKNFSNIVPFKEKKEGVLKDIEKILKFWKITKNELFSITKNIWSKSFRPSNTNKDLVGSGFDTSN